MTDDGWVERVATRLRVRLAAYAFAAGAGVMLIFLDLLGKLK